MYNACKIDSKIRFKIHRIYFRLTLKANRKRNTACDYLRVSDERFTMTL